MDYKDLRELALAVTRAEKDAPVCFSFGEEKYSAAEANEALAQEFRNLCGYVEGRGISLADYRENKNLIFRLIEETITDVLPKRVEQQYAAFADVKTIAQGDKAVYRQRITEAARKRAKKFVTRVGLAGRYEVFMLDGKELEVKTAAIGYAARIGFEEFLDGRWQFSDFTSLLLEGVDEYIYREIAKALAAMVENLPTPNKAVVNGFSEDIMDELLAISDSYAKSAIYCTQEFAAKMLPAEGWVSNNMKDTLWNNGWLGTYKQHQVIILEQSLVDETNTEKVMDPAQAYIIPIGSDKPVKLVFEGQTCVRTIGENVNDDWSTDLQAYLKFGIAVFSNHWICSYRNTKLSKNTRVAPLPNNA